MEIIARHVKRRPAILILQIDVRIAGKEVAHNVCLAQC